MTRLRRPFLIFAALAAMLAQGQAGSAPVTEQPAVAAGIEAKFNSALAAAGLTDKAAALRAVAGPAVSLTEQAGADAARPGASRVGGGPDLPGGMEWPRNDNGFHLNFLAQVDLAQLPDRPGSLPADGLLSFFIGTDYAEWRVIHSPTSAAPIAHPMPDDAEDVSAAAFRMVVWNPEKKRFIADGTSEGGLVAETDANGRITFLRDGKPVIALASEYDISRSTELLRAEPILTAPIEAPGYDAAGIDDGYAFHAALREAFATGEGPQHQMFGHVGAREWQAQAVAFARKSGWDDLTEPADWFVLLKLASGGAAGFNFGDAEPLLFVANRKDTARGDFSRVYAFLDQG